MMITSKSRKAMSKMNNQEIRKYAKSKNINLWEIAKYLNISEPTMTRKLRVELSEEEKQKIFKIIDELANE